MIPFEIERLLSKVQKPARYCGGEINTIVKDKTKVTTRVAFCFPDLYEVGMSHLGMKLFYSAFNKREEIWCERVFAPAEDMRSLLLENGMKLYGLECLEAGVQDQGSNFTRFICISKNLEIYPGADRTSLMAVLPHEPGSLCRVLSRFYALGLNLNKLESRPMPERNFEFMFYFDLETPVYAPEFLQLMGELPSLCEEFSYLGSYSEVV